MKCFRQNIYSSLTVLFILFIFIVSTCADTNNPSDTVSSLPGIELITSVDKAEAYIGDLITYKLEIIYDSIYKLIPTPLGANLGAFDVKDYDPDVESKLKDGRLKSQTTFILSTFTTGDYTIPPLPVGFTLPDSSYKILLAEPIPIKIVSLLGDNVDSLDSAKLSEPKGMHAQYEFPMDYTEYYLWGGAVFLLIVAIIIFWILIKKRKSDEQQVDLRPPWEIAFEKLAFLKESDHILKSEFKGYYIILTEIVRVYLGRMYEHDLMELTTEQCLETLCNTELPDQSYEKISTFFKHADLVKYARDIPSLKEVEADFDFSHQLIDEVRQEVERIKQLLSPIDEAADTLPVESKV